ncbi:Crp/Fnr family transcriptional regulator [Bradyrhizobium sp. 2TAF24]|uniref:Crp/Fnr family transcriptional regulator n=1 Tax=Bradyrhizobium sp. 2TAF24 TaxID=3233011 RepID=UPI003F91E365
MTLHTEMPDFGSAHSPKWRIATEGLDAAARQMLLDRMRSISYDARDALFDQGEPSDTLVLLTDGRVRLSQTLDNGEEFTFCITTPGTLLGLAALVTGQPRILSATAIEPVTAALMTRTDFLHCLTALPRFHWNVTRLLAMLSVESIERSGPMALDSAAVRLGTTLKSLARPEDSDPDGRRLAVAGLSQGELARMIGVSRSWVAIALAQFERDGLIARQRGRIVIVSLPRLDGFITAARNA